jgi:chemotaxis protein MotB
LAEAATQVTRHEAEKAIEASARSALEGKVQSLTDELAEAAKQVARLEAEKAAEASSSAALAGQVAASADELTQARKRVAQLEEEKTAKEQMLADFQENLRRLEEGYRQQEKAREALQAELGQKSDTESELRDKVESARARMGFLEGEMNKTRGSLNALGGEMRAVMGEKTALESKLQEVQSTYDALITELKHERESKEVEIENLKEKISVTFVDRIFFDSGRAVIKKEGRQVLSRVGKILKNVQDKKIVVVGHTDSALIKWPHTEVFPSNWELSAARAAAVVRYFQKEAGLDPGQLEAVGRAFYEPVAGNDTPEGRAQNRRVNILITATRE